MTDLDLTKPAMTKERIISVGYSAGAPRVWDGKTVVTFGPKGFGIYDINSEWMPAEFKQQADQMMEKVKGERQRFNGYIVNLSYAGPGPGNRRLTNKEIGELTRN